MGPRGPSSWSLLGRPRPCFFSLGVNPSFGVLPLVLVLALSILVFEIEKKSENVENVYVKLTVLFECHHRRRHYHPHD